MNPRLALLLLPALLGGCPATLECPQGEVGCDGACVALASDARNCGACGNACGPGFYCSEGACTCAPGTSECAGRCADLSSDPAACGSCEVACGPAEVCSLGGCAGTCDGGLADCDRACVDLGSDRFHCGACDVACSPGQSCDGGTCRAVFVACFATDDVRTVSPDLAWAGPARSAGDGPISLAPLGDRVFAASSISHSLAALPLGAGAPAELLFPDARDLENVAAHGGLLYVSNSGGGTLLAIEPGTGAVIDEVGFGVTTVNPRGVAFVGDVAYVALYGVDETSGGQEVAVVDFAGIGACTTPPCGELVRRISVLAGADEPGLPFPSRAVAVDGRVYVTLANLRKGDLGYYTDPAGDGKLAVIDARSADELTFVTLPGCRNPGGLALRGTTIWVACGAFDTQAILPVETSSGSAVPADPVPTPSPTPGAFAFVPGTIAFCGDMGYVSDQWSGDVIRFDPADPASQSGLTVCPLNAPPEEFGWAWAADLACAP